MDSANHDVCDNGVVCSVSEWPTLWKHHSEEGFEARGPYFAILVPSLHVGVKCFVKQSHGGRSLDGCPYL